MPAGCRVSQGPVPLPLLIRFQLIIYYFIILVNRHSIIITKLHLAQKCLLYTMSCKRRKDRLLISLMNACIHSGLFNKLSLRSKRIEILSPYLLFLFMQNKRRITLSTLCPLYYRSSLAQSGAFKTSVQLSVPFSFLM